MIVVWIILALIALFLAVVLLRAACFKPLPEEALQADVPLFDAQKAIDDLQAMIRCKTVSDKDKSKEDEAEFEKLLHLLPERFPNVYCQ